jgi:hypothetical protein
MPRRTSGLGEATMLQRSVERLSGLVRLHGGLIRMPRNGSSFPRAGSGRPLAGGLVSGGHALALDGVSVPTVAAAGSSTYFLVRRLVRSGGSVSSLAVASGLDARPERRSLMRRHDGATDDLVNSPDLTRAPASRSMPVSGRRPGVSPNAARCRSRRGAPRWAAIPMGGGTASRVTGLSRASARLRTRGGG